MKYSTYTTIHTFFLKGMVRYQKGISLIPQVIG